MQVFSAPHFPFGNALEEEFFVGKTFGFRAQTIPSVTCQQKERECRALRTILLTKVFMKSVGRVKLERFC